MSADPMREYRDAKNAYDDATKAVDDMVQRLNKTDFNLKDGKWRRVTVYGVSGFPGALQDALNVIRPADLPRIEDLGAVLVAWHRANEQMRNAWPRVPAEDQRALVPPPSEPR